MYVQLLCEEAGAGGGVGAGRGGEGGAGGLDKICLLSQKCYIAST